MEERTGWWGQNEIQMEGEEKRNDRFVGAAETSGELAEWYRHQRKNLSKLGLPKRKEWPQCHQVSSWQRRPSRLFRSEKKHRHHPDLQTVRWERVKVSESCTLAKERGIRAGAWGGMGGLHSERRLYGREERQTKRTFLGEVGKSTSGWVEAKALQVNLQSLGFIPSLAEPEMDDREKWVWLTRKRGKNVSERKSELGENKRQPVMARLTAR